MDGVYKQAQRHIVCISESTNIQKYFIKNIDASSSKNYTAFGIKIKSIKLS